MHDRAHVGVLVERITDAQLAHPLLQQVLETLRHAFGDQNPRAGAADLTRIEPDRVRHAFDRRVQIGIGEDHEGRLAAQLQRQRLSGAGRLATNAAAHLGRAGEGNFIQTVMRDDGRAGATVAGDNVEHALGQPHLGRDLGKGECGERGVLGRLQHHGVARGERGRNFPGQHQKREVPRDDLAADAMRRGTGKLVLHDLGPAGMVVEVARHQRHVGVAALADRLAVVETFQNGEKARVLLHVARDGVEIPGPLVARQRRPARLPRASGLNGDVDVLIAALRDRGQQLARGGGADLEGLARRSEGAVDEMAEARFVLLEPIAHDGAVLGGGAVIHGRKNVRDRVHDALSLRPANDGGRRRSAR